MKEQLLKEYKDIKIYYNSDIKEYNIINYDDTIGYQTKKELIRNLDISISYYREKLLTINRKIIFHSLSL